MISLQAQSQCSLHSDFGGRDFLLRLAISGMKSAPASIPALLALEQLNPMAFSELSLSLGQLFVLDGYAEHVAQHAQAHRWVGRLVQDPFCQPADELQSLSHLD